MEKSYAFSGTCARGVTFERTEDGKIRNIRFTGGCNGNLKAIGKLIEGKPAEEVIDILKGNDCAGRGTSCADQLAIALEQALEYE